MIPTAARGNYAESTDLRRIGRGLVLLIWVAVVMGPFGLFPGVGHHHSHAGPDAHCAACMMLHSGIHVTTAVTAPVAGDRVWEPLSPEPIAPCVNSAECSFLRRAPPLAS